MVFTYSRFGQVHVTTSKRPVQAMRGSMATSPTPKLIQKWQRRMKWLMLDGRGRLYCQLCPSTLRRGGLHSHKGHLKQHAQTLAHRMAAASDDSTCLQLKLSRAPPEAHFLKVWDHISAGHSPWQGVDGVGKQKKVAAIRCCIAEAIRGRNRAFIENLTRPYSICLQRDESKHRLMITFTAVDSNLTTRTGMLGWVRCSVADAVTKTEQTGEAMQQFCTTRKSPASAGRVSMPLYNKLRKGVEFMATDAAAPELLSVKMMHRGVKLDGHDPLTPHLKCHTRDKAHATKRILGRPFDADAFLRGIKDCDASATVTLFSRSPTPDPRFPIPDRRPAHKH